MAGDYADRLDPSQYDNDLIVALYRKDPADSFDVPERVFRRLVQVAKGYELHLLPMLGDTEPVSLSAPMIQTRLHELRFVGDRLNDPVTDLWISRLLPVVQAVAWEGPSASLTVEGE
ncbi:hypothetical protein [Actinoplanes sp. M2I2]|uniref:hypothetical protein n=1 Tax=Actinoplanes sp. M2I2 TaxID=1734444 RepID=UPI002020DDD3|nr:hypothetical protein [Actinoplanes sp. M2I2]